MWIMTKNEWLRISAWWREKMTTKKHTKKKKKMMGVSHCILTPILLTTLKNESK